jgi:hypothetical protein
MTTVLSGAAMLTPLLACACHQDTVGAVQQTEREILEAAAILVHKLAECADRSDAARAAARRLRVSAAVRLNRYAPG